jgi:hypothetical protein
MGIGASLPAHGISFGPSYNQKRRVAICTGKSKELDLIQVKPQRNHPIQMTVKEVTGATSSNKAIQFNWFPKIR